MKENNVYTIELYDLIVFIFISKGNKSSETKGKFQSFDNDGEGT